MSDSKQCLFCGKTLKEEENICEECKDHMDHQYTSDFWVDDRVETSPGDQVDSEEEEPLESIEHEFVVPIAAEQPSVVRPKQRTKISKGIIFLIVGSVILVVIGIIGALNIAESRKSEATQEAYWMKCVEENTPLSYSKYLVRYPDGNFAEEAEKRIRESREAEIEAWKKLRKSSDINAFYAYLSENPKTPHLEQIRLIMDSLSWATTSKDNTADAYKAYMENVNLGNVAGMYMAEAQERYDYLSQLVVLDGASLESLKVDIVDFLRKLSDNKPKDLLRVFASKTFYYTNDMSSTRIVSLIADEYTSKKIKKVVYTIDPKSLTATRDNRGVIFAQFSVEKEFDYNIKKKKKNVVKQNLSLEINSDKLIHSIKLTK